MNYLLHALLLSFVTTSAWCSTAPNKLTNDIVCSLAPSQSDVVASISSKLGGTGATVAAISQAAGLTVVTHSSGGLILTGSSGYVAGTLGGAALAMPVIIGVSVVVVGSAVTVELLCAPKNHPNEVEKVKVAAKEFIDRSRLSFAGMKTSVVQSGQNVAASVKRITGDVFDYAYRK